MPKTKKEITSIHVNLEHKEDGRIILGYIEVDTFSAAQKHLQDNYPDYELKMIEQGHRKKL